MKKYRKNSTEVEAIQHNGTFENLNEIKELLPDETQYDYDDRDRDKDIPVFTIGSRTKPYRIYKTDWIVKDGKYFFVISNDIFIDVFTEISE